jgi:hypothetical protein
MVNGLNLSRLPYSMEALRFDVSNKLCVKQTVCQSNAKTKSPRQHNSVNAVSSPLCCDRYES